MREGPARLDFTKDMVLNFTKFIDVTTYYCPML